MIVLLSIITRLSILWEFATNLSSELHATIVSGIYCMHIDRITKEFYLSRISIASKSM